MLDRRSFLGQSMIVAAGAVPSAGLLASVPMSLAPKPHRFRYATFNGPPTFWNRLKIVERSSGLPINQVIEASAEEGWLRRYVDQADGESLITFDGRLIVETVETDIDIILDTEMWPPGFSMIGHTKDDVAAGVVYDEDLTDEDREWIDRGMPYCRVCSIPAVRHPMDICGLCRHAGRSRAIGEA